jgi:hypothetical protein
MSTANEEMSPYAKRLLDVVVAAVPNWVDSSVRRIVRRHVGVVNDDVAAAIVVAGKEAQQFVTERLSVLLAADVDQQTSNPLQILRDSARFPTQVLLGVGVPAPKRDHFDEQINPDDVFGLGPYTWRDLGEEVHDAGIEWGAWKAASVLSRRRSEGKIS